MPFIKLTRTQKSSGEDAVYLATSAIVSVRQVLAYPPETRPLPIDASEVLVGSGDGIIYTVRESPADIMQMVERATGYSAPEPARDASVHYPPLPTNIPASDGFSSAQLSLAAELSRLTFEGRNRIDHSARIAMARTLQKYGIGDDGLDNGPG